MIYHFRLLQIMNIRCQLSHQAIIQLDNVALKKSTKEHGYCIAVTSLNKIGEDSCAKYSIFLKSESFESIFLSTTRRQHEPISNISYPVILNQSRCDRPMKTDVYTRS